VSALRAFHWPQLWLGLWGLMIAAVIVGSLAPSDALPQMWFPGADKLQHLAGYAVLSGYAAMLFASRRAQWVAAAGLVLLGILIEGAQSALTVSRQADPVDMLANLAGVALGQALGMTRVAGLLEWVDRRISRRR
jgi:VanZ family protein